MTDPRPNVRVVHVLGRLSRGGGVQTVVRGIIERVDPAVIDLHLVTARPIQPQDGLEDLPVAVHPLGVRSRRGRRNRARIGPWDRLLIVWRAAAAVRRLRPDVVHLHSGTAWFGAGVRLVAPGARVLIEIHDAPGSGRHGRAAELFEGAWLRWGGAHAVCHTFSVRNEVERRWKPPSERAHLFPLGIDTSVLAPGVSKSAPGRGNLVAVGRLVPSKRFDLAVEVVAGLRDRHVDVDLVIVGLGPEHDRLTDLARQRGVDDRVHLVGARYGSDLAATIGAADVLISTSSYEGFGLTVVEAMACETAVVTMKAGGVVELLAYGGGEVVESGDVAAMIDALERLLADDEYRRRLAWDGRRAAEEHFSLDAMARRFFDLYRQLAGHQPPQAIVRP